MTQIAQTVVSRSAPQRSMIERLGTLLDERDLATFGERLRKLDKLASADLEAVDAAIAEVPRKGTLAVRAAGHLLDLGGKRLRPLCVALASRVGHGFDEQARLVATAVELVHSATLLHDDVVDYGEVRRGAPTARAVFGNAASIYGGDWLLIEALACVHQANIADTMARLMDVIREMITGEALQLELRGKLVPDRDAYLAVVEGKTAALFAWATYAGARAGGVRDHEAQALERYGRRLGVAFQIVDDMLDFAGKPERLGKALHGDLREGKTTYPLLIALEKMPKLRPALEQALAPAAPPDSLAAILGDVQGAIVDSDAIGESRRFAEGYIKEALRALEVLPQSAAREALETVAAAALSRDA
jgi:octaprenyl-diphosphate synthase